MSAKPSSPASVFEKVLRACETGAFTFTDVLRQLRRLLATGASPAELLETLRRRELIEPLPKNAHVEVVGLLNDAMGQAERHAAVNSEGQNTDPDTMAAPMQQAESPATATTVALTSVFEKVMRASEIGAFTDADVLAELKRLLLVTGTTPTALLEILRRRQLIEPLSEHEYVEVVGLLNNAMGRAAAWNAGPVVPEEEVTIDLNDFPQGDAAGHYSAGAPGVSTASVVSEFVRPTGVNPPLAATVRLMEAQIARQHDDYEGLTRSHERTRDAESTATARATALAADLAAARHALESEQSKTREINQELAEGIAAAEAAHSRSEEALRESERYQTESRTLRDSLAARDATITQVRHSLAARDAQLAALQKEHAKIVPTLEARAKTGTQLEADLLAARTHADAITLEFKASQDTAALLKAQLKRDESHLDAVRTELSAVQSQSSSYLELLRTREWRSGSDQNMIRELDVQVNTEHVGRGALQAERDHLQAQMAALQGELGTQDALIDQLRTAARADAQRAAQLQAAAQLRESEQAARIAEVESAQAAGIAQMEGSVAEGDVGLQNERSNRSLTAGQFAAELPAPGRGASRRGATWKPGAIARATGVSAAVLIVAAVAWFFSHRTPVPTQMPAPPSAAVPDSGTLIRDCPTCPAMTVLPAGRFEQGSAGAESGLSSSERPLHWVAIGGPLAMSTNAVTVDEFGQFIAATGRDMQGCDTYNGEWKLRPKSSWKSPGFMQTGTHPVTCASWNDAEAYAQWLTATTGHRYRLPSASEWEYAASAGGEAIQPWNADGSGACASANVADESAAHRYPGWMVFACDDGYVYTAPVGSFKTNSFGLNDMLGNVFQWTEDCWHADYAGAPIDGSARRDGDCSEHELRGGSWFTTPAYVRANYRNHFAADYRTSSVGIRLMRDIEQ
jgi:formylglycine-generating enzyme